MKNHPLNKKKRKDDEWIFSTQIILLHANLSLAAASVKINIFPSFIVTLAKKY